jgi:hypothetical protein
MRWQFGVLAPPAWAAASGEPAAQRTQILMEPRAGAVLHAELRFLHAQRRTVERALDGGRFEPTDELSLPDRVLVPWDEGVEDRVELSVDVAALGGDGLVLPFSRPAHTGTEQVAGGRIVRRREPLEGVVRITAEELPGPYRVLRLTATIENSGDGTAATREDALSHALISAHLMLALTAGSFISMTDPPEWARGAVAECRNEHTWPVLAGEDGAADVVLSSPIILEDHPQIAPESPGQLYDATEIDEILALRTAALTDDEKRQARGTDDRAAAVIDLADSMPPEVLERLHGAVRALREVTGPAAAPPDVTSPDTPWWDPGADASVDPARDRVMVEGVSVGAGSRVVLRPGLRRSDAQDLFLHGRTALVEAVLHDVDGAVHLAVTVEGDPGAEVRREQGRFLYFQPDELAPADPVEAS